jgi:hypothetical protein
MRTKRLLLLLLLLLAPFLAACAVETPFSVNGKPKLTGSRCTSAEPCQARSRP